MSRLRLALAVCGLCLVFTGCAGTIRAPKPARPAPEKSGFVPDASPMPGSTAEWIDAANRKEAAAQFVVSMMYRDGMDGVANIIDGEKSPDEADPTREMLRWRNRAEFQNFALAQLSHQPGLELESRTCKPEEHCEKAMEWLEQAAKRGYANSEFILALAYLNGIVTDVDWDKGKTLLLRAAEHGVPQAQYYMGMLYALGMDRDPNPKKALEWLDCAFENGNTDAGFVLAMMYKDGIQVTADTAKSEKYRAKVQDYHPWCGLMAPKYVGSMDLVCSSEYDKSEIRRKNVEEDPLPEYPWDPERPDAENERLQEEFWLNREISRSLPYSVDFEIAKHWLADVASKDEKSVHARILRGQSVMLTGCHGGDPEGDNPAQWFEDMIMPQADLENCEAEYTLGGIQYTLSEGANRKNAKKYATEALNYWERSAEHGCANAQKMLGDVYSGEVWEDLHGSIGQNEDHFKAFDYYKGLADTSSAGYSATMICQDYFDGDDPKTHKSYPKNVKKVDKKAALEWCQKGAEFGEYRAYLIMGQIYEGGKNFARDEASMLDAYKKYISHLGNQFVSTEDGWIAKRIGDAYAEHADGAETARKWYRIADEIFASDMDLREAGDDKAHQDIQAMRKAIDVDVKDFGLREAIEAHVRDEHENASELSVYSAAMMTCEKKPDQCQKIIAPMRKEAIDDAFLSIVALVDARGGSVDDIRDVWHHVAIYLGKNKLYRSSQCAISRACAMSRDMQKLYEDDRAVIEFSWFLSQVSAGAKAVYESKFGWSSWDSLRKSAAEMIAKKPEMQGAFDFDFDAVVQKSLLAPVLKK